MSAAADDDVTRPLPTTPAATPGHIGRYELLERIGKGGMGVVHRARDKVLDRQVAIKMLAGDLETSEVTRERFFREARSAGQLAHRNIITIYDFGEENGRAYIVMELLYGESLTSLMARVTDLPLERRIEIMTRVCEGLAFAHSRAIVHRDVKPANIFITSDGGVKILDFGLARIASSTLTRSGLVVGTPDYMSPEQVKGKVVDQRSDIFSVGAVFYQLLAGHKPFAATVLPMVLHKVVAEDPPPLSESQAPPELARIIARALEKRPAERYQQMQEMLVDLTRFAQRFEQVSRELANKAADRYRAIERLLEERSSLAGELGITVEPEEVVVASELRDLPLFDGMGGEVLRVVPFRRARIAQLVEALDDQYDRLTLLMGAWREAMRCVQEAETLLADERADVAAATGPLEALAGDLAASARVRETVDRCRERLEARRTAGPPDAAPSSDGSGTRVAGLLEQAREAMGGGDLSRAAGLLAEVLALDAANVEARALESDLEAVARREESERHRREQAERRAARPALRLARWALARGDLARALWAAEHALALNPSGVEIQDTLARARQALEDHHEAETIALPSLTRWATLTAVVAHWMDRVRRRLRAHDST